MNPYAYFTLCFGFTSFIIALFVWMRLGTWLGFRYFFFSACSGLWAMLAGICMLADVSYETALLSTRISHGFAAFIATGWYHFTLEFCHKKSRTTRVLLGFLYLGSFVVLAHTFSDDFIENVHSIDAFKYFPEAKKWVYHFFTAHFFLGVAFGFFNLISLRGNLQKDQKKSCDGLIVATTAGFLGGGFSFATAYGFPGFHHWLLLMPLYPILMALAMMRFDLFSVESFAQAAHKDKLAALGMVTASMNHEIRSPLFLMRGLIETKEESSQFREQLLSQINRVTDIVSRLTHFAKKGVDEEAKIESLDLNEVLADIRPLFQHQLNYQSIELTQEIPKDLPRVMADRRYLEEILFNLILNACQALKNTQEPQIKLSASVFEGHPFDSAQGKRLPTSDQRTNRFTNYAVHSTSSIAIAIEDNGPGFTDKQLKNVFKPFHTTKEEGTGLGLYITKQLVEKCGGRIEIKSEFGRGAVFVLEFQSLV